MKIRIKNGKVYAAHRFQEMDILVDGRGIAAMGAEAGEIPADMEYDAAGCYVTPGFIDIHTHGGC